MFDNSDEIGVRMRWGGVSIMIIFRSYDLHVIITCLKDAPTSRGQIGSTSSQRLLGARDY
jgi:hypothetical protein